MFIWLFHRISGVFLIFLIGMKIFTSYFLFNKDKKPDWALSLHRQPVLDILILILFTFHSIYGLRTIAIDLGYRKEKELFLLSNIVASLIALVLIYFYVRITILHHDILIIGGGLASMRAAVELYEHYNVGLFSKVHPIRSHSIAAQGGVNVALANNPDFRDDTWEKHAFDTV